MKSSVLLLLAFSCTTTTMMGQSKIRNADIWVFHHSLSKPTSFSHFPIGMDRAEFTEMRTSKDNNREDILKWVARYWGGDFPRDSKGRNDDVKRTDIENYTIVQTPRSSANHREFVTFPPTMTKRQAFKQITDMEGRKR